MANVDNPNGIAPVNTMGQCNVIRVRPYYVPSTYATALFIHDPVVLTGTANTAAVDGFPIGTLPEINKATAGATNRWIGSIVSFSALPTNLSAQYNPASTARIVYVSDDPLQLYLIQDDAAAVIGAAAVGLNGNFVFTHAGSTATGISGVELNAATVAADATFQLKIVAAAMSIDNDLTAGWSRWVVMNNLTQYAKADAGV